MNGTRAPAAKNFVATAMPKLPVALSRAMIDHVIGAFRESPSRGIALHAARIGGSFPPSSVARCRREPAFGPVLTYFNNMAASFQLIDGRFRNPVFQNQHAWSGGARPE